MFIKHSPASAKCYSGGGVKLRVSASCQFANCRCSDTAGPQGNTGEAAGTASKPDRCKDGDVGVVTVQ